MKQITFTLAFLLSFNLLFAQIQNDQIDLELQLLTGWSSVATDGSNGQGEYVLNTTYTFGGSVGGPYCHSWIGASSSNYDFPTPPSLYIQGLPADAAFDVALEAWESDDPGGDYCNSQDPSSFFSGLASDHTLNNPLFVDAGGPSQWLENIGNSLNWLFDSNSAPFDMKVKVAYRYSNGDDCDAPLDFGTLNLNNVHSHFNNNGIAPDGVVTQAINLGYTDTDGQSSNDVFYQFVLSDAMNVVISTDHPETNFDTQIVLYAENCDSQIGDNDDGGANNTSVLDAQLCPGTYLIKVEGYQTNQGNFTLSLTTSALPTISLTEATTGTSCSDSADGEISINSVSGGLTNIGYDINWSNGVSGAILSNLSVGSYTATITDVCGTAYSQTFEMTSDDSQAPVVNCDDSDLTMAPGSSMTLEEAALGNVTATDNCSNNDITLSYTPATIIPAMIGMINVIDVTATDASGNSTTCSFGLLVTAETSSVKTLQNQLTTELTPNPTNGLFTLTWDGEMPADAQIKLMDVTGKIISNESVNLGGQQSFDLSEAPKGLYFVQIISNEGTLTERVILR